MIKFNSYSILFFIFLIIKIVYSENSLYSERCGKGFGSCKKGECCSKYGWCGKTDRHCKTEEGCQSEFGMCKPTKIITTTMLKTKTLTQIPSNEIPSGKCGKGYGSCKKGECCSKYGWCGKSYDYCGNGCQSEFGDCYDRNEYNDLVENNTDNSNPNFDFSFLKMENNKENMLYSPLSIKYALYMLKDGADGHTFDEINEVIGSTELHKYSSINKILSLTNGLFIRDPYYEYIKTPYINTLNEKYDAEVVKDEFKDAQNANQWIEDKTFGIIKNILEDEVVQDPNNVMFLINTLAIDMEFALQFDYDKTYGEIFYRDDGQEMTASMMSKDEVLSGFIAYYKDDDITVLTMDLNDYNEIQLEFMVIMPNETLSTYIENVSKEQIDQIDKKLILSSNEKDGIYIGIPKFKFSYNIKLKNDLEDLGIKDAFNSTNANFSKMTEAKFFVSNAFHKADIDFTEKGVTAAAVTVFDLDEEKVPDESRSVHIVINKPFMFIIRDKKTKDIWFTGTVYEPNSWENDKENYKPSNDYEI